MYGYHRQSTFGIKGIHQFKQKDKEEQKDDSSS